MTVNLVFSGAKIRLLPPHGDEIDDVLLQHEFPFAEEFKAKDLEIAMRYGRWLLPEVPTKTVVGLIERMMSTRDELRLEAALQREKEVLPQLAYEHPDQQPLKTPLEGKPFEAFYLNEYNNEAVVWIPAGIHEISYFDGVHSRRYKLGFPHLYVVVQRGRRVSCGIWASSTRVTSYSQKVHSFPMLNRTGNGNICFSYMGKRPRRLRNLARKVALAYLGTPFNMGAGVPLNRHPIDGISALNDNGHDTGSEFLEAWEEFTVKQGMKGILDADWHQEGESRAFRNLIHRLDEHSYGNVLHQTYYRSQRNRRKEI